MKNTFIIMLFTLLLNACKDENGIKSAVALTETFISDSLHFSIMHPKNWEVVQNPNDKKSIAVVEKIENEKDAYQENIVCWLEEMPMALTDSVYFKASVTQLKLSNPKLDIQKNGNIKLGENNFSSFAFDFTTNDSTKYEVQGYCLVKGNRGYNFSCTATKTDMPKHTEIFREILSTFKPL